MIRFLARTVLNVLANAVGLLAAAAFLDGFNIDGVSFVVAVLIFTGFEIILGPWVTKTAIQAVPAIRGGVALVTTFVSLFLTSLFTDGFSIDGLGTWFMAIVIVWAFTLIATLVLPLFLFKKTLEDDSKKSE